MVTVSDRPRHNPRAVDLTDAAPEWVDRRVAIREWIAMDHLSPHSTDPAVVEPERANLGGGDGE